jgi:hypothetical protein
MHGEPNRANRERAASSSFPILRSRFSVHHSLLFAAAFLIPATMARAAQPPAPPAPAKYQVVLRYRIAAARDQHVLLYDAMVDHLRGLGFAFNPPLDKAPDTDRENRFKNYLKGTIASDKFRNILVNPSVASVLVLPEDYEYPPQDLDKLVRIRVELAGGLSSDRQRELAEQVKAVLAILGFREAPAYDHQGYSRRPFTRLAGTIPQGRLEVLLKDLRGQPAGWFASRIPPGDLPSPLRSVNPIRIVEVLPDPEPIAAVAVPQPRIPTYLEKISPDLWALVSDKGSGNEPARIELIFTGTLVPEDQSWRQVLQVAAPGIFVEGRLGQMVSAVVRRSQVKALAALPLISTIRLQRPAQVDVDPALSLPGDNAKALSFTGLDALHQRGYLGKGVRLAILDTDFRGWADFKMQGKLPSSTRLVDLTTELDPDLYPAPSGDSDQIGHGTLCARAAALAAPQAELVLIRIDASSPYQIDEVVRYLRGDSQSSPNLDRRRDELVTARAELNHLHSQVQLERRVILESYIDESELQKDFGFLGPVFGWIFSPRTWSRDQVAYVEKLDKALAERNRRFFNLVEDIRSLAGIMLVANPLVWNDGLGLGGASPLSRAFDRQQPSPGPDQGVSRKAPLLWFQAAGNTRGQTWAGLFRDENGNGFMEFAPPGQPLAKGQWTTELNFLAWKPFNQPQTAELPQGARLRIALQWREPHDPDYFTAAEDDDFYRKPLADLRLSLVRQRDPSAKTLAADAFDEVAVTSGSPQRLEHQPGGTIYEIVLETTVDKAGHYAVRLERPLGRQWVLARDPATKRPTFVHLEGLIPSGLRPLGVATLPALEKHWELQPRLFVDVIGPERRMGRPLFADFTTDHGSVGVPGDARSVISVGAADWHDEPRPYSAGGPLVFAELAQKPTLLAYDALQLGPPGRSGSAFGTSIATSFAAGTTATLLSAGMSPAVALRYLNQQCGKVFKVPGK